MIGVINYGMGNLKSVCNALRFLEQDYFIINSREEFEKADKLILPGVGAFGRAMENLHAMQFTEAIQDAVLKDKKAILGLCLGMQLLFEDSCEHGFFKGLALLKGHVYGLDEHVSDLNIPHMGWNNLEIQQDNALFEDRTDADFYFVHSYYCKADSRQDVLATVTYGVEMDVMVGKENIFGCQFHPEKSQKNGLNLLNNFCKLEC